MTPRELIDCIRAMTDDERQELSDLLGGLPFPWGFAASGSIIGLIDPEATVIEGDTPPIASPIVCTTDDAGRDD